MSTSPATAQDERFEWEPHSQTQPAPGPGTGWVPQLVRRGFWAMLLLGMAALGLCELHYWMLRGEIWRKQSARVNSQLVATRMRDARLLSRYQWVKQSEGVLRVPESVAASLVIADYAKEGRAGSSGPTALQAVRAATEKGVVP